MNDYLLVHHGIQGMKWGQRNGPPYPLDQHKDYSKRAEISRKETDHYSRVPLDYDHLSPADKKKAKEQAKKYEKWINEVMQDAADSYLSSKRTKKQVDRMIARLEKAKSKGLDSKAYYRAEYKNKLEQFKDPSNLLNDIRDSTRLADGIAWRVFDKGFTLYSLPAKYYGKIGNTYIQKFYVYPGGLKSDTPVNRKVFGMSLKEYQDISSKPSSEGRHTDPFIRYDWPVMSDYLKDSDFSDSSDYLMHYGKGHLDGGHSGRYPWGSGKKGGRNLPAVAGSNSNSGGGSSGGSSGKKGGKNLPAVVGSTSNSGRDSSSAREKNSSNSNSNSANARKEKARQSQESAAKRAEREREKLSNDLKRDFATAGDDLGKLLKDFSKIKGKKKKAAAREALMENISHMTDQQLREYTNRLNLENNYVKALTHDVRSSPKPSTADYLDAAGDFLAFANTGILVATGIKALMKKG